MQRQSKTTEPTTPAAETLWSMDPQSVEIVTRTYKAWFDQANRMREETLRFAQARFEREIEAAAQFARCSNPTEALAVQTEFANRMAADYLAEGQKMAELMGEMARQISPLKDSRKANH